jgi:polysaccharide pyruvyl transferase WcaK-like protein
MPERVKRVLILAGDTDGNVGDRAIVLATCQELRRQHGDVRISLVSGDPDHDKSYFAAETIRRGAAGIPKLLEAAWRSDLILCGGGGLFQDDTSLVKMPYWALRLLLVRCVAREVVGYSIGVGPLQWRSSRLAARTAFACMRTVSVRDELARKTAQQLTTRDVCLVPDPALMLAPAEDAEASSLLASAGVPSDGSPLIGVSVRRWFHHRPTLIPHKYAVKYHLRRVPGGRRHEQMIGLLATVLDRLVDIRNARIVFMPTYAVPHEADDEVCQAVMERMESDRKTLIRIRDPRLYKAVAGRMQAMLCGRMHPAILAAAMGTPIVGFSYNQKFQGFFNLLDMDDRVIGVEDFVAGAKVAPLVELLLESLSQSTEIGCAMRDRVGELIEEIRNFTARLKRNSTVPNPESVVS